VFDRFSPSAGRAIFWARKEAGRLGEDAIGPEHLLLGILIEDQGASHAMMYEALGVAMSEAPRMAIMPEAPLKPFFSGETATRLREGVVEQASMRHSLPDHVDMALTQEAKSVLSGLTQRHGEQNVNLLDLLRELFEERAGPVSALLLSNGITAEQVDAAIREH